MNIFSERTVDIKNNFPEYKTVAQDVKLIEAPLWYHLRGLMQTSTGFGRKLVTPYKIEFNGRKYRVYCTQISNSGSLWFTAKGFKYFLS